MKKFFSFVLFAAVCFVSCTNKSPKTSTEEFQSSLISTDTIQMLNLGDSCMTLLKDKNIEGAMSMLFEYDDSTKQVVPLGDDTRVRYEHLFKMFPVLSFHRLNYTFMLEGLNNLKYEVIFAEEEHPEVNGVPKTTFMFNPVKVDGQWYLTVKRADQQIYN